MAPRPQQRRDAPGRRQRDVGGVDVAGSTSGRGAAWRVDDGVRSGSRRGVGEKGRQLRRCTRPLRSGSPSLEHTVKGQVAGPVGMEGG
jgi:hypothetical protein